ncbi:16S rRNA (cytosine(1402)-N(4))-methyltransferase RsmH [Brumimicrobium aurantiacum]|uniref:Ribosomal RNA small subunit methyltransferase H n=1 Tax=Brumimicrobium aurantiacum TaxID=1737063 RepID=A0A3E1EY18_9FLAO|nr:16S rRNA (cytosine(1402)-N(4))-methyltransferase RsmH [Brumimicrobium aurantiacum]RFC54451.1 16S rRNA (cytosine(1402)-N(4))-methyltransferase RsmH [Brumimicrobium aurantiacum]
MEESNNQYGYHVPVMLKECLDGLDVHPDGTYVDLTFGGGGHAREIYKLLSEKGSLIVFDQDADAKKNAWTAPNFHFVASNFSFLKNQLRMLGITKVDGILADLGVSSHQFNEPERGFSIRADEKLDMRMNQRSGDSAFEVVNEYTEEQLMTMIGKYGEVKSPRRVAQAICLKRQSSPISTTGELINVLEPIAPKFKENRFYAQVFQAIRIEVNDEMNVLERMLEQTAEVLNPGGRLVVMSYHSLEDRLVKNYIKSGKFDGKVEKDFFGNVLKPLNAITRKPVVADEEELERNSRARSAKLRVAERNEG